MPKSFAERDMLFVGDVLIMEYEYRVFTKRAAKLFKCFGINRRSDVNTLNFRPDIFF